MLACVWFAAPARMLPCEVHVIPVELHARTIWKSWVIIAVIKGLTVPCMYLAALSAVLPLHHQRPADLKIVPGCLRWKPRGRGHHRCSHRQAPEPPTAHGGGALNPAQHSSEARGVRRDDGGVRRKTKRRGSVYRDGTNTSDQGALAGGSCRATRGACAAPALFRISMRTMVALVPLAIKDQSGDIVAGVNFDEGVVELMVQ